jgi:nucleoside-diphosphate-sugar epimerase
VKTILIGATGFVGSNLLQQMQFDASLSSRNISDYKGQHVDLALVAAGDARKWYANQNPEDDRVHIERVIADISAINIKRVLHFSTVDVYASKQGDEAALAGQVSADAYGGHRHLLEQKLKERFDNVSIIRLPGLYGPGLKKNIIFDISLGRDLSGFNPASAFQWFDLLELKRIVDFVERSGLKEVNVCAEPLRVSELLEGLGLDLSQVSGTAPLIRYDIRTSHSAAFGADGDYLYSKAQSLAGIKAFLATLAQAAL